MTFQFDQIDKISDVDQAMDVLQDSYIPALIDAFVQSPEGQAYLKTYPEEEDALGEWVDNFVYFSYGYLNVTLPKLKERDVKEVLLGLFPRKISLLDPDDADSAIPELIAFWQFLQREYKQRNSQKILAFLHKIQPTFKATMNDPRNFGMAKSFLLSGQAAGFDMTTEEGLQAFQEQYNQQLRETGAPPPGFPALPSPMAASGGGQNPLAAYPIPEGVPPEFVALLSQQLGLGPMPGLEHLPSDPEQLVQAIAEHLIASGEVPLADAPVSLIGNLLVGNLIASGEVIPGEDEAEETPSFFEELQAITLQRVGEQQGVELSEQAMTLLRQQPIAETEPGTIVKDFETLLDAMGDRGLPVSGKLNQFSLKLLGELNDRLSHPIQIAMQRPQQKSYPNLHGLYLLLRVTGLAEVVTVGKSSYLQRNPELFAAWKTLNSSEKYFTLLEAWIVRGDGELLGDDRSRLSEGTRVLQAWTQLKNKRNTFRNYGEQQSLSYWPGFHNLALMQLFGWLEVTSAKPETGKGWRVKQVKTLPLGDAMATLILQACFEEGFRWKSAQDFTQPWGELQPYFQPYFPHWNQNLPAQKPVEHQPGTYIFKVSLDKIWRRISISSESTLDELAELILDSVDFDSDHLDMFSFKDRMGRTVEIHNPLNDFYDGKFTDEVSIGDLPLKPGMTMTYLFDFGDNWKFTVLLEEIQPGEPKRTSNTILERHGKAPEQYPDWDGE